MQTISEAIASIRNSTATFREAFDGGTYVPARSRWTRGDVGDPECPECLGLGYLRLDLPVGHPNFGQLFACECAAAKLAAAKLEKLRGASMLEPDDLALTWGKIVNTPAIADAVEKVRTALDRGYGWVYLWGPPGPGKTLVLKTAVAEHIRASKPAVMAMWADLLDHLRAGYNDQTFDERVGLWRTVPVLAIDEFGRAKDSEWVQEARAKIFNPRYESATYKKTVTLFASNFPPGQAEDWFADRLRDKRFAVVEIKGPSMRRLMGDE